MNCKKCGRKAVTEVRYLKQYFCDRCFLKMYERKVRRTIKENNMLDKRDKVVVGVSGGKDSLVLLYLLKKKRFDITALTIDEGIKPYRTESIKYVKKFCKKYDIPHIVKSFKDEYGFNLDKINKREHNKPICSYCGVLRRDLLNKTARELKADKVATGHNLDDEAQTVLMNFYRSELKRLARMGPVTGVLKHKLFIPRIKPLRDCLEKENIIYALLKKIEFEDMECPYQRDAYRNKVRDQLNELEERYPGTKISVLKNLDRLLPVLRKHFKKVEVAKNCKTCGEITSGQICKACDVAEEFSSA